MGRHYLVVSDLHLADVEDHDDGWKAYKSSRFLFDEEFATLVAEFTARHGDDGPLTLVLNGDIFDFDLVVTIPPDPPWPISPAERISGLAPSGAKSAWKLQHILSFHPRFLEMLADFLAAGHQVVHVLGNHDREFHFPEVQHALRAAIARQAAGRTILPEHLSFEPWFYYVPGEIYVEHGHQYDYYTAFKNQLAPTVESREGPRLALSMGNLSNRYLTTRMGTFNPHATDFILNFFHYIRHWFQHYLFSRRSLVLTWFWGSLIVLFKLLRLKRQLQGVRGPHGEQIEAIARRFGLEVTTVKQLNRLHLRPITNRVYRIVREFWLDRLLIAVVMTGGTIALALVPIPLWIKLMVPLSSFPLLYLVYEWLVQGESVFSVETRLPTYARIIATLLPVHVVTFGHTHKPKQLPLGRGVAFVDTGTWAPITRRDDARKLRQGLRTYLLLSVEGKTSRVILDSFMSGPAEAEVQAARGVVGGQT